MQLDAVFRSFDRNGDGKISAEELASSTAAILDEEFSIHDAAEVLESVDSDGDGLLDLDELMKLAPAEMEEEERSRCLRAAFQMFESDGDEGCITARSLRRALRRLGMSPRGLNECRTMIGRFDLNGDGVLNFDEFRIMMLI